MCQKRTTAVVFFLLLHKKRETFCGYDIAGPMWEDYIYIEMSQPRKWCNRIHPDKTTWPLADIASQCAKDALADDFKRFRLGHSTKVVAVLWYEVCKQDSQKETTQYQSNCSICVYGSIVDCVLSCVRGYLKKCGFNSAQWGLIYFLKSSCYKSLSVVFNCLIFGSKKGSYTRWRGVLMRRSPSSTQDCVSCYTVRVMKEQAKKKNPTVVTGEKREKKWGNWHLKANKCWSRNLTLWQFLNRIRVKEKQAHQFFSVLCLDIFHTK